MPADAPPARRRTPTTVLFLTLAAVVLGLTPGRASAAPGVLTLFDDMEHGDPLANGWFAFGGAVGGGGIDANGADLPPSDGGAFSLQSGWGSGGTPGFYGGFGRTRPTDLTGTSVFNLWINPDAGQDYTLEINLQEDDDGNDAADTATDDEFQYDCVVSPTGPCAVAGGGWQQVSIPFADFVDDNSFFTGGNGILDAVPVPAGGNGQLINVVVAVIGNSGSDATFRTDFWAFTDTPLAGGVRVIDDFEGGLPSGTDGDGVPIGFFTFSDGSPIGISTTSTPPAPVPGAPAGNTVLAMTGDVAAFAGYIHAFENPAVDAWVTQDWSTREGISFWMHGQNTGTDLFIDILDNRNPGSTADDAERFTAAFADDFDGWRLLEFPFADFTRKEIGNGAPNDGLGLFEMHGYAIGTLDTPGEVTFHLDDVALYGVGEPPALAVQFAQANTFIEEGTTGEVTVRLNRPFGPEDPAQVSIDYRTEPADATPGREYTPTSGTLTFVNGGPTEQTFTIETFDDTKFEGNERIVLRLTNPVDVERGALFQGSAFVADDDPYDPNLLDDVERGAGLWDTQGPVVLDAVERAAGAPDARPGQDAFENVLRAEIPVAVEVDVRGGHCAPNRRGRASNGVVPVVLRSTPDFDATTVDHTTVTFGEASEAHVDRRTGLARRHEEDVDRDGRTDLVFHFRARDIGHDCADGPTPFNGATFDGRAVTAGGSDAAFHRDFALGQDWSGAESLSFWYRGDGDGRDVTVTLKDNRAPDPGPAGWELAWSDEFDAPAGTPPDPANWTHEIGDVTPDGKNGWGNEERQYYTDSTDNAAHDGDGALVMTLREADGSRECYYGPCEYTSARLLSWHKAEFAYGRIESRLRVPDGGDGLWPAFWSLGTDIDRNPWPGAGEIDFMEYVSRLPDEIFGTIHGPGYAGGASFNGIYDFGEPVFNDWHTFTVEWEPEKITWYVDGIQYHQATPADVAPDPWVFDKPFFLLLNFAIGGNFGGAIDPANTYPQEYLVDYVRVYSGPDTAERFEATFIDDVEGWRQVTIPFTDFVRSADQPAGAPDDGLGLDDVWGYGFALPEGTASGVVEVDRVELVPTPPPTELVVTTLDDRGPGSLRDALAAIAEGGTITFDPALAGGGLRLTSGPLTPPRDVVIDATGAPGVAVDGGAADRVLVVDAGRDVTVRGLTLTNGFGFQLAGCVLNNGALTLDHVTVAGCTTTTDVGDFWQGGGGVYNGDGASLNLVDSTVADNRSGWAGGGVFSFLNTTTNVTRSTVSGNVATDVGGGFRTLGAVRVDNSTISGNTSTAWHGGAMFVTDGVATVTNSTLTGNTAPAGTAGGLFVGTFGPAAATGELRNTIVADNGDLGCFLAPFGAGPVAITSLGTNVFTDASCTPAPSDQVVADAGLGALADNGGPTSTHALLAGSPAIDAADAAACPATDQRGVARDAACDVGAFEFVP